MTRLRMAVIGGGRLGTFHARNLAACEDAELAAVVDPIGRRGAELARQYGGRALADHRPLLGEIDAAIVAAPTVLHHQIGLDLLGAGIHVLMEKPLASTLEEANQLVDAARGRRCVLQVGHVERFNPAFRAVEPFCRRPRLIEAAREIGYSFRSTDVGVVLDLMIHDIDIALALAGSRVRDVQASGRTIVGPHEDDAEARLLFENGCVAVLRASRVSFEPRRSLRVSCDDLVASVDYAASRARLARRSLVLRESGLAIERLPIPERERLRERFFAELMPVADLPVKPSNAILEEQRGFIRCILGGTSPRVGGEEGRDAIEIAERVLAAIRGAAPPTAQSFEPPLLPLPVSDLPRRRKAG